MSPSDYLAQKELRVRRQSAARALGEPELETLRARAARVPAPPDFAAALRHGEEMAVIAEFKRQSPSAGPLPGGAEPIADIVRGYEGAGASAVSVLTDTEDFGGSTDDLRVAAASVRSPVLRKDFLVDERSLYEARLLGASAALLIMRILRPGEAERLLEAAASVGLACLVEVHDPWELEAALAVGAGIIGINNRDLQRMETDLAVTERIAPGVPPGITLVSESGVRSPRDVVRLRDAGAHAVLVGEALMGCGPEERGDLLRSLSAVPR